MSSSLALAALPMIVESDLLGSLTCDPEDIVEFPNGLFGFPNCRGFLLLPAGDDNGLYWLQSVDSTALAFLLVDPFRYFDGYAVDLAPADLFDLGADGATEIAVLAIVTLPRAPDDSPTANLRGPLALNLAGGRGKQLAISESEFGVRCPFQIGLTPAG